MRIAVAFVLCPTPIRSEPDVEAVEVQKTGSHSDSAEAATHSTQPRSTLILIAVIYFEACRLSDPDLVLVSLG